ncbi:MAG: ankyrin repeat domain-containing protein [Planctomycetota bacterium]|nr:ankyrin repeat domain-containing protein [Planctomycetota bacterium]
MKHRARTALSWTGTILIFSLLGLVTSVGVAWGAAIHIQAANPIDTRGVVETRSFGALMTRGIPRLRNGIYEWRLYRPEYAFHWSLLGDAPQDPPQRVALIATGWPMYCLGAEHVQGVDDWDFTRFGHRDAIHGMLETTTWVSGWYNVQRLPRRVIWPGLIMNVAFWGVVSLFVFCLPSLWQFNRGLRYKLKHRCIQCGYACEGLTGRRCPECGNDVRNLPWRIIRTNTTLASIAFFAMLLGLSIFLVVFSEDQPMPALHRAAFNGDHDRVREEIRRGADLDFQVRIGTQHKVTSLILALYRQQNDIAEELVDSGASILDADGMMLGIDFVINEDLVQALDFLIDHGLLDDDKNLNGSWLIQLMADKGHRAQVARLLDAGVDPHSLIFGSESLLHIAARQGWYDMADRLLDEGLPIDAQPPKGEGPPLQLAITYRHLDLARRLIERGANVNLRSSYGESALNGAIVIHDREFFEFLVEQGAEINGPPEARSPLFVAVAHRSPEFIDRLLELGADVNGSNHSDRMSILGQAMWMNYDRSTGIVLEPDLSFIRRLLDRGADVNGCLGQYESPLSSAIRAEAWEAVELLVQRGAKPDFSALFSALNHNRLDLYRRYLEQGVDPLEVNHFGQTLFFAVSKETPESVWQELVDFEIDINARASHGEAVLYHVIGSPLNARFVQFLISHGADPTLKVGRRRRTIVNRATNSEIRRILEDAIEQWELEHGEAASEESP